jgi:predicted lipoprotein with Yx(FWY)xxD motif
LPWCARTWRPLLGGAATGKGGANPRLIGLSRIAGGDRQVTYNRHPLYIYVGDHRAGQANGEAKSQFGGKWYAVNVAGSEVAPKGGTCNPVCGGY